MKIQISFVCEKQSDLYLIKIQISFFFFKADLYLMKIQISFGV